MYNDDLGELESLFLALADKTRLRLLRLMAGGEVSVGYLAAQLGESQPKISRHLAYLRNAGLVDTRRDGKWIYYFIKADRDSSAERVLKAILVQKGQLEAKNEGNGYRAARIKSDISADANMSEFRPNQIDIFLL